MSDALLNRPLLSGVIGYPIGHSLSPAVHGHWLRQLKINALYMPFEITPEDFPQVLRALPKLGFRGVNITIPHKEAALQHAESVSDQAALIGAVNTITITNEGRIHGDNTDAHGFLASLREAVPEWNAVDCGPIMVIGAGGAARAVIYALISDGAEEIHIANRSRERAEFLKTEFGNRIAVHDLMLIGDIIPNVKTIVNTTALGMAGKPPLIFPHDALVENTVVSDLVYTPLGTEFLVRAEEHGCRTVDGLGMLLHQAAASFSHWFGTRPAVDEAVRKAALAA
ncbi:MAG: shikimate dehydrogenase [Rhodobacteraceae bacterium]|nr:shikimate dehydrogenase [Paracoccaceae bacterium]